LGKASTGAANFSPKTKDAAGNDIHYLDHSVTAKVRLDGGGIVTLKKTLSENWKKKRGSITEEFSGHNTVYEADGVPKSESEYNAIIADIVPQDKARILSSAAYFPETISWQDRRKILVDVCGDVSDEDVLGGNSDLTELRAYLQKPGDPNALYTADEAMAVIKTGMRKINGELDEIPARVDECNKAIPDLTGLSREAAEAKISELETVRAVLEREKAGITESSATAARKGKLSELRVKLNEAKAAYREIELRQSEAYIEELSRIGEGLPDLLSRQSALNSDIVIKRQSLETANRKRGELTAEYRKTEAETWLGDTVCAACGQSLPAGAVAEAREKWEANKKQYLQTLFEKIKTQSSKEIIAGLEAEISAFERERDSVQEQVDAIRARVEDRERSRPAPIPFEETSAYREINAKMSGIQAELLGGSTDVNLVKEEIQRKIDAVGRDIAEQRDIISKFTLAQSQTRRADELSAREKELAKEYERLEKGVYLCELFIKSKVAAITDRINAKFSAVRFRLFVEQINGGIREDCEVLVPGETGLVPYSTANNAARINAGIEIINVLSEHWGVTLPLFVDNRESVITLAPTAAQVISLVVSERDEKLKTEVL
jgi:hypothetical protein